MGYFKRYLREHIAALDEAGFLVKIDEQINKDTELMPLVRWQFRGLSEEERRAFMFQCDGRKGEKIRYSCRSRYPSCFAADLHGFGSM